MLPLACSEEGRSLISREGEKYLMFAEFLGVFFEGKEGRVLELPRGIEQEARGVREKEIVDMRVGKGKSMRKDKREKVTCWSTRGEVGVGVRVGV